MAGVEKVVARDAFSSVVGTPDRDAAAASRMVALPLRMVDEMPAETLVEELRARFGPEPLDCLILEQPVSLSEDWRRNDVDHASRLLSAWNAMSSLAELGATRAVGVANAGEAVIDLLLDRSSVPPSLNQIEFHPYLRSSALVSHCRGRGVAVQALRWLGPADQVQRDPRVLELSETHGRSPAEIVLKWCLSRVDGVVGDGHEEALVPNSESDRAFDLSPDELASLDRLDCGYRIDRSPSTLASIYGNLGAEPVQVRPVDTGPLEVGCHKVLYAPVSGSESFNRRFSFLVWRGLFNLPATAKHVVRRRNLSTLSERIASDLGRDGYALSSVGELGCEESFRRLADDAARLFGEVSDKRHGHWHDDLGDEVAVPTDLRAAIDAYFGLKTKIDAQSVLSTPGRLDFARRQQLWHSDVEDLLTVKVYTFLTDVDASSGALEYIAESHPKGRFAVPVAELWKHSFVKDPTPAHTFQVSDELLFRHVRPDLLRRLEGPAGTVVVFDARGLHRGGHVLQGVRQVAITSHTAPNYAHPWRPPDSRWSSLWSRFRWETNVKLREPDAKPSA
jgi:diketogulonate reductase-like aldo/keto reductase